MAVRFGICAGWPSAPLGAAHGRRIAEIELAVVQIRHAGQALTERIQADDVGIHLPDAHRQRVDLFLQDAPDVLDLRLLAQQFGRPIAELIDGIGAPCRAPRPMPMENAPPTIASTTSDGSRHHHRMAQVKLFHSARSCGRQK